MRASARRRRRAGCGRPRTRSQRAPARCPEVEGLGIQDIASGIGLKDTVEGLKDTGLGFRVWDRGFEIPVEGLGFRV